MTQTNMMIKYILKTHWGRFFLGHFDLGRDTSWKSEVIGQNSNVRHPTLKNVENFLKTIDKSKKVIYTKNQ